MKPAKKTTPGTSNRTRPPGPARCGRRSARISATSPSGRLIRKTERQPQCWVSQPPATGPKVRRGHEHRRHVALVAGALARRDHLADQRLRQRHQPAAAEPLQHARGGDRDDGGGEAAEHGSGDEHAECHQHHPLAPERVAEPAIDRRRDRGRDQVGHDDPGDPLDLAEAPGHRRQGGRDDGAVERRQEHRQHDRREDAEEHGAARGLGGWRRLLCGDGLPDRFGAARCHSHSAFVAAPG